MRIKLSETEKAIIAKHDPSCRGRALIELDIVSALCCRAIETNFDLEIEGGEKVYTSDRLKQELFDLDDAVILVYKHAPADPIGWIKLVFGNDGYDLISDYTTNLDEFLKPVNELADFWGGA